MKPALLSLIFLGLGQVYNREFIRASVLYGIIFFTLILYILIKALGISTGLIIIQAFIPFYLLLKIYSIIQAYIQSRKFQSVNRVIKPVKLHCYFLTIVLVAAIHFALYSINSSRNNNYTTTYHPFNSQRAKDKCLTLYNREEKTWPVPFDTTTIHTSFGPTYVRISGSANDSILLLLHGGGSNSLLWSSNINDLARVFKVYTIDDIIGTGKSIYSKIPGNSADYSRWINELLDSLGITRKIYLAGLSYGGWQAANYCIQNPGRVSKLALIAPAGTVQPLSGEWIRRAVLSQIPYRYFTRQFFDWLFEDARNSEDYSLFLEEQIDKAFCSIHGYKKMPLPYPGVLSDEELKKITLPSIFIVGEHEKIYSASKAIDRLELIVPDMNTKIIPGAGHDLSFLKADELNGIIIDFLN